MADWKLLDKSGYVVGSEDEKLSSLANFLQIPSLARLEFAVSVIEDRSEPWIIRAEACRFIRDIDSDLWGKTRLCEAINQILADQSENWTLQQWAAFLVNKCLQSEVLASTCCQVLIGSEKAAYNVIDSLEEAEIIPVAFRSVLQTVLSSSADESIRASVQQILSEA